MVELGMEEDRARVAKDAAKARQRAIIVSQLNMTRASLTTLNMKKIELEGKIEKITTALTNIESAKGDFDSGKSSLDSVTIEAGSWKGQNATKANTELGQMKTSVQTIGKKIDDTVETIQEDKTRLEQELERVEAEIATKNAQVSNLIAQLNSL